MCVVHTVAEYLEYLTNIKSTLSLSNTVSCNTFFAVKRMQRGSYPPVCIGKAYLIARTYC